MPATLSRDHQRALRSDTASSHLFVESAPVHSFTSLTSDQTPQLPQLVQLEAQFEMANMQWSLFGPCANVAKINWPVFV